jgi:deoxyguanosine kinase
MFIALEGCVGAGKSTIATGLAAHRDSTLLLEQFEQNPFLSAFYEDPAKYATETEFMFLLLHYHQLKRQVSHQDGRDLISDFHLGKDLLYARMNFENPATITQFEKLFDLLNEQLPQPDLLIGLSAPTELIIDRIRKRDRRFELKVESSYYERINSAYQGFFDSYGSRKLILSMAEWDFVENPDLYDDLSRKIDAELQS